MSAPSIRPISPEERKLWEKHNLDTLREWRALSFTDKIRMLEEMEELVRAFPGGRLPRTANEQRGANPDGTTDDSGRL